MNDDPRMEDYREKHWKAKGWLATTGETHDELADRFYRASGDCICDTCGKKYYSHPYATEARDRDGTPYLNVLCDGDIVKL